jgi:capsular polysaccharide biosynthesis protein
MNENIQNNDVIEVDVLELLHELLKKWWLILLGGIIGAIVMIVVTKGLMTPMYQSTTMLYILNKTTTVTTMADIQIGSALTLDFQTIATSKPVIDTVIQELKQEEGIILTRKEIRDALKVTNIDDTRLLKIAVEHENPEMACLIANAMAEATSSQMALIMKSDPPTNAERAEVEQKPVSPNLTKNVVLGAFGAAFLVCVALAIVHMMNDRIKTEEDIEKYLGVPTVATIPYISTKERKKEETVKRNEKK